ncbi:UDP-N-acetylmuramate--L-alanine ligase [Candidatus Desantisbacteria bacterium CG2_30_40_21]|uniref:UDP-N-acetylmuramate--L-alanine ligase n=5 Tax=unclassified Candidatus Desantisiibacteriota TaxID=3106372 RepID=A0A2M7J8S7_9BACT|nr:MAG: UDP-N-acetylmuramate--L-alanine ligase [Candidatus Desantisbacteria bacterium CG2_30_40_21]PIP42316.1 MAG: UDP-N-acetylmuramate--L-alanine ligase [Candidatus Desantisbacteria bacterium CG23_combo_of_CG06-09_8_20_14_all_40_23]PIX15792.1 MAG: UDP-N-acetylmuramate--L-alanine ligase [Candidatus Desantisbacteria bacterium CG_4_8_14_3_um_filter_40_12]PIY19412.1 MAG: UDP-N-acetylmuramate--L-alanine ligase [Candidatus Desantisbacteria bacterium CG_4_10_14_3_um_filter_40_18]PJB29725.1 MAG: UDP-N
MFKKIQNIHFIGIGGSGMSGIAEVLLNLGYTVTGSDMVETEITKRLQGLGGRIYIGHSQKNIEDADVVVYSSAVSKENPEVLSAKEKRIPIIPRAEMLAELMRLKYGIAVAGAHGKTTTTSMISIVLSTAGLDPTVVIGGRFNDIGSNARLGSSEYLVAESDESDGSFLKLSPIIAVVTNIDEEHLDYYQDISQIKDTFLQFMNKVPFYGSVILCLDNENLQAVIDKIERRVITYGLTKEAQIRAEDILFDGFSSEFTVIFEGNTLGRIRLKVPGIHYVSNALAAVAVGLDLEIEFEKILDALGAYSGVQRRFQITGEANGVTIIDDYAHHPTEIAATLAAIKSTKRRVVAVFQPHRYTRTKALSKGFGQCFNDADMVIVTNIYGAGEKPIEGVDASLVVKSLVEAGHSRVIFLQTFEEIIDFLHRFICPQDVVVTLGAGNIWKVGKRLWEELRQE